MSSSEEVLIIRITSYPKDESYGIRSRRQTVGLSLRRTIPYSVLHGNDQHEDINSVSNFRFELPYPCSREDILRVLIQHGVEVSYCESIAREITTAVEKQLQLCVWWFHLSVNVRIMNKSEYKRRASKKLMKTLQRINGGDLDLKRDDQCSICLEGLSSGACEIIKMPCSHLFHESCIFTWLCTKNCCPLCRQVPSSPTATQASPTEDFWPFNVLKGFLFLSIPLLLWAI